MTTVGSGHLSYYQAAEQGFQGCLETTRADLGSGPPVCWGATDRVRCSGTGPGSEVFTAPAQPNQRRYEALRAYFVEPISVEARGRGRIRCVEIGVSRGIPSGTPRRRENGGGLPADAAVCLGCQPAR